MEKQAHSQLELFSQDTPQARPNPCASSRVLCFLKQYEKAILILMGFLVTSVVSFSLGVEKGRKMFVSNSSMRMDMAMARVVLRPAVLAAGPKDKFLLPEKQAKPQVVPLPRPPAPQANSPAQNAKEKKQGIFTLQLASYQKRDFAQKEAAVLSKKGIAAFVLAKGNYFVLYSGNFPSRQAAKMLLAKFKKQYRDCIVRRL